jgi:opacity protein-like surface antigen
MQKILAMTLLVVLTAVIAIAADEHPKGEAFLGYDYTRVNSASNVPAFSANGGTSQFSINFGKYFGFVSELGAVHNGNISSNHIDTTLTDFLFGPRVNLRYSRFTPFFHVLLGGVHGSTSTQVQATLPPGVTQPIYIPGMPTIPAPGTAVTLRAVASETAFAWAPGGGIDIKINKHASFRAIELDYYMMRLQNLRSKEDNNQHCLRFMTGFNFTFGAQ